MTIKMIINDEGDFSSVDTDNCRDYISMGQAINILTEWEMEGKTIHHINEYNIEKWWTT